MSGPLIYRARKTRRAGKDAPKNLRYTLDLLDEANDGMILARCAVTGTPIHKPQVIELPGGARWTVRPNRKIMPSHWLLADPEDRDVLVLDQRIFGKLAGPLTKAGMTIKNPAGEVLYTVVEPDASVAERLFGPDPDAWRIENESGTVGLIATLSKSEQPAGGWRGRLQRFVQGTDMGLVSLGEHHLFDPPQALAIVMIFRELRDITNSVE